MLLSRLFLTAISVSMMLTSCAGENNGDSKPASRRSDGLVSSDTNSATADGSGTKSATDGNTARSTRRKNKKAEGSFRSLISHPDRSLKECIEVYLPGASGPPGSEDLMKAATKALDDKHRDYDAADVLLTELLKLDPENGEAYFQRGRARANSLDMRDDEALQDFDDAIRLGYKHSSMYEYQARIFDGRHQPQKALEAMNEAIKFEPRDRTYYRSRATLYLALDKKELARKDYDKAVELDPGEAYIYLLRGQLLESMNLNEEALKDYRAAAASNLAEQKFGKRLIALKGQAILLRKMGRYKEAIDVLKIAIATDKNDEELFRLRGQSHSALKMYEEAIADYTKSIDLAPSFSSKTFIDRSNAYEAIGKNELAEKDRQEAKRLQAEPAEKQLYELKK